MTELEQVMQTKRTETYGAETRTVYLMDGDDIGAYLVRRESGLWAGYIAACLHPDEPTFDGLPYDEAVPYLLETDAALVPLPVIYSNDEVVQYL